MSQLPRLNTQGGIQGYYYVRSNSIQGQLLAPNEFANATRMSAIMDPVLEKMKSMPGMESGAFVKIPPVDFSSGLAGSLQSSTGGSSVVAPAGAKGAWAAQIMRRHGPGEMEKETVAYPGALDQDSLLLGEEELTHPGLAEALRKSRRKDKVGQFRGHVVGGNKVFTSKEDTSIPPAWRRAYVHMMVTGEDKVYLGPVRALSPPGLQAAYINEVSVEVLRPAGMTINNCRVGTSSRTGKPHFGARTTHDFSQLRTNMILTCSSTSPQEWAQTNL
jgi:hypothetical protein